MIFETFVSITLLYLYLSIQSLYMHFTNIDKDNTSIYNNISRYIKEYQTLFSEINCIKEKIFASNENIDGKLQVIYRDIKLLQNLCNSYSYDINMMKEESTISNYTKTKKFLFPR